MIYTDRPATPIVISLSQTTGITTTIFSMFVASTRQACLDEADRRHLIIPDSILNQINI